MPLLTKYKNQPIIVLNPNVKPPYVSFSFGLAKARVIIDKIFDIEKWYNDPNSKENMDITPQINKDGKRFIINKYKGQLILQHKMAIAEFIERTEIDFQVKLAKDREYKSSMFKRGKYR